MKSLKEIMVTGSWGLRLQVFVSGAVIMALEIMGSRLLAPVYGNSVFVWGSLIGVVLTGLALGYYYGGRFADRWPSMRTFSSIIFSGGLYTVMIPFISPMALDFALRTGLGERYGPLIGTTLILGPPSMMLGMVSPYAVKLAARTLTKLGNVAGNLYSLSTLGSILGTFLTIFVLIPSFDVRSIIFSLGLVLMLSSLLGMGRTPLFIFLLVSALVLSPLSSFAVGLSTRVGSFVVEKETPYNHLQVLDLGKTRTLYLNGMPHSAMYLNGSNNLVFTYTRYFHLGFLFNPKAKEVLFVGGGGFSGPKNFLEFYRDVRVDVVEIDPDVIEIAKKFFNLRQDSRLDVINDDARVHLSRTNKTYDVIILDAYSKSYVPFHLMTKEFYSLIHKRLSNEGVFVLNLIGSLVGDTSDLFRAEYKTASQVFPSLYVFPTSDLSIGIVQNIMLVGTKMKTDYTKEDLMKRIEEFGFKNPDSRPNSISSPRFNYDSASILNSIELQDYLSRYYEGEIRVEDVPTLKDSFAPVENLLNPVTGKSYSLELEAGGRSPWGLLWTESSTMVFMLLTIVIFVWLAYLSTMTPRLKGWAVK